MHYLDSLLVIHVAHKELLFTDSWNEASCFRGRRYEPYKWVLVIYYLQEIVMVP